MNTANLNRLSRIIAIQTTYSMIIGKREFKELPKVLNDIKDNFIFINGIEKQTLQVNIDFISKLLIYMFETSEGLEQEIKLHLSKDWRYERISIIIQVILKIAISELLCLNTLPEIVINEYTTISSGFVDEKEVGFINGLLQKISDKIKI